MISAGTIFSGIGAPECAAPDLDWRWAAEIDPFASAVHAARFPGVPNLGNVLEIDWHAVEPVDLVVGGPPCQDYSVAGQRASLAGARGDLTLQYARILDAIDPAWSVTENVPGWLSTPDNAFEAFLGILVGADSALVPGRAQRWTDSGVVAGPRRTAAWRILDAQYFGVPQRRRRVFVVACRGSGNWACAEALFPLRTSVRRDTAPRREAREDVAAGTGDGTSFSLKTPSHAAAWRGDGSDNLVAGPVTDEELERQLEDWEFKRANNKGRDDLVDEMIRRIRLELEVRKSGRGTPLIAVPIDSMNALSSREGNGLGIGNNGDPSFTLSKGHSHAVMTLAIRGRGDSPDAAAGAQNQQGEIREMPYSGAVKAEHGMNETSYIREAMSVRRLTPRESARLQGFPDDWCAVEYRGKPAADGPMYRAYGNSMAVPVIGWVLSRVQQVAAASLEAAA